MDGERKYRHRGYMDTERDFSPQGGDDRQRPPKQRLPLDVTGPRLPRLVQAVAASRCYNCASTLPNGTDYQGACPKCAAALHCCKQCAHFEPSTRFQCRKPVPVRIAKKDERNTCELFSPRVTVAREATAESPATMAQAPRTPADARAAFDNLFKK